MSTELFLDYRNLIKKILIVLTKGFPDQKFLGAFYIPIIFKVLPKKYHRNFALNLIAISPHYFSREFWLSDHEQSYKDFSYKDFLESENERMISSRRSIMDVKIKPYLNSSMVVLDHGCGPGYLTNSVAPCCKKVIGVDISGGVIACAKAINNQPNIEYLTEKNGEKLSCIENSSIDVIYSTAVMLHVTDDVCKKLLREFFRVLKPECKVICEFVLKPNIGSSKNEIIEFEKKNEFILGRIKEGYSLRIVERARTYVEEIIIDAGFKIEKITDNEVFVENGYCTFVFRKP
jgi:ubiquinone/menaquinone biosynthesis C-methylase UbiE